MNICKGITSKKQPCKKVVKSGEYCIYHLEGSSCSKKVKTVREKPKNLLEKPEECCVCMEPLNDNDFLSCGHWMHMSCIIKTGKTTCPVCRAELKLLPKESKALKKVADKNKKEKDQELIRLDREIASRMIDEFLSRIDLPEQPGDYVLMIGDMVIPIRV